MRRRRFGSAGRQRPLGFGSMYGFLQPRRREDDDSFRARLRQEPELRREVRTTLLVQLTVVGALFLACLTLVVQAVVMVRRLSAVTSMGWVLPVAVGLLALLVARRFLRLLSEYRRVDDR